MYPDSEAIDPVLKRTNVLLKGYLNDQDFLDTVRLIEVTVAAGKLDRQQRARAAASTSAEEYPAREVRMNRELIRVLAYLARRFDRRACG